MWHHPGYFLDHDLAEFRHHYFSPFNTSRLMSFYACTIYSTSLRGDFADILTVDDIILMTQVAAWILNDIILIDADQASVKLVDKHASWLIARQIYDFLRCSSAPTVG
jgi:hypothetical protein